MTQPLEIGLLLFPHVTQLDLTGPAQVFATATGTRVHLVWKDRGPVMSDAGFALIPTTTFDDCPPLDVVCVPGGPGQQRVMQDPAVLSWLGAQGQRAQWVTSVCSGSLLLGAAGLLTGYRAASHWHYRSFLPLFGAIVDESRVVRDRNRLTGGGVTAGIDLALAVVAALRGEEEARQVQLLLEYAPEPPFDCGRPEQAGPERVAAVEARLAATLAQASEVAE